MIVFNPTSRKEIRFVARRLRRCFGLDGEPYFPVVEFLEMGMPLVVDGFAYDVVEDDALPGKYAETVPELNQIRIRESTYEAAVAGNPRARFTIAHEIGHGILADDVPEQYSAYGRNDSLSVRLPAYRDPEWQANEFAAELLAPCRLIGDRTDKQIERDFGVSNQVANIQLSKLRAERL